MDENRCDDANSAVAVLADSRNANGARSMVGMARWRYQNGGHTMKAPLIALLLCIVTPFSLNAPVTFAGQGQGLIAETFPDSQAELRDVVDTIANDVMTANIESLQALHLVSEKFSKFGPRSFDRQDVAGTNASEAAFFSSVSDMIYRVDDLKIDVFGDIGIVTYYPRVSFVKEGETRLVNGRQTLVFLKTDQGWKIVHEHGTVRQQDK